MNRATHDSNRIHEHSRVDIHSAGAICIANRNGAKAISQVGKLQVIQVKCAQTTAKADGPIWHAGSQHERTTATDSSSQFNLGNRDRYRTRPTTAGADVRRPCHV